MSDAIPTFDLPDGPLKEALKQLSALFVVTRRHGAALESMELLLSAAPYESGHMLANLVRLVEHEARRQQLALLDPRNNLPELGWDAHALAPLRRRHPGLELIEELVLDIEDGACEVADPISFFKVACDVVLQVTPSP